MTDAPEPDAPMPSPASPYGPADGPADVPADGVTDGVQQLFGDAGARDEATPANVAAPALTTMGDSEAVTRSRRTLARLALALPIAGLLLSIVAIVIQVTTGGSFFGIDPVSEISGFTLTFLGPTLLVLGLHMLAWRALVRPLARMTLGARIGTIIGVGALLSFISVILVFILVFAGFIILSSLLSATDQAL